MSLLIKLSDWIAQKANKFGAQYTTFAILSLINQPIAYFYELQNNKDADLLWLRILSCILNITILFRHKLPQKYQRFIPLYWYTIIIVSVPVITTILLLSNNFALGYLINFNIGIMIVLLLVDWLSFLIIQTIGVFLGILITLQQDYIYHIPNDSHIQSFVYMFLCIIILNSILSRNKEIYTSFFNKAKDELNSSLEQKILERTSELEKALLAKTEFLNNMSHEVRTPIQGFTVISQGLVDHWRDFDDNKKLELASQIASNAQRLSSLVSNLLDLSKFSAGKILLEFRKFDLNDLIENMIDECKALYTNGKVLEFEFTPADPGVIVGDQERISQVLRNLFVNAIKFSNNNSTIEAKLNPSEITYDDGSNQEAIHFSITDQGIGIPEDELESIFSPFFISTKTKTKAGGTGLGLSISREIIDAHHGRILAKNNEYGGACFSFVLPIYQEKQLPEPKIVTENDVNLIIKPFNTNHATILIIDDEEACLTAMEMLLYGSGHKLIKATGGIEALDYLRANPVSIDIIMLDLMMPDMYGLNVLTELKQDPVLINIPVILQTGTFDEREIDKAYKMGIISYIAKPYEKKIILELISKIL